MELKNGQFYGTAQGRRSSPVATLAETSYASGAAVPTHTHRNGFFCLVVEGELVEHVEGAVKAVLAGGALFHPAEAPHSETFPSAAARVFNIQPDGAWLARARELDLTVPAEQRIVGSSSRLASLARQVRGEWRRSDPATPLAVEGLLLSMLAAIVRAPRPEPRGGVTPHWLLEVRDALHDCIAAPPTIVDLAASVGVAPAHLTRAFGKRFECPPGEYLRRLRVNHVRRRLEQSDVPLVRIALEAGFSDQSHLTRVFRRYVGTTPGRYRAAFRGVVSD